MKFDDTHLSVVAAVASAIAAGGSVWAAFKANSTSKAMAKIELERRHQELRPIFTPWCEPYSDTYFHLCLRLDGADGLDQLDSLKISITNNKDMSPSPLTVQAKNVGGRPTTEDIKSQIWSPFRFSPNVSSSSDGRKSSEDGRSIPYPVLRLGDEMRFQMERTPAPVWNQTGGDKWWQGYGIRPVLKISVECQKFGLQPWVIPLRLATPLEPLEHD